MSLIDYIAVDEALKKDVLDARVVRGMFQKSDHYVVLVKIKIRYKWEHGRKGSKKEGSRVLATGRLDRE